MLDEQIQNQILEFIRNEATRIKYGKLYIELSVIDSNVLDMEVETKKRIHLKTKS